MNLFAYVKILTGYTVGICQLLALFIISVGIVKALWVYIRYSLITYEKPRQS